MGILRSLRRLVVVAALTFLATQWCRLRRAFASDPRGAALPVLERLSVALLRALAVDVRVYGRPPPEWCVVVANHRSYVDVPLLMSRAPSVFLAKAEVAAWPLFGAATRLAWEARTWIDRELVCQRPRGVRLGSGEGGLRRAACGRRGAALLAPR